MILPLLTWLLYAFPAYLLWPVVFRLRYGHAAWVEPVIPRNAYQWTDFGLGVSLVVYSVWLGAAWVATGMPLGIWVDGRVVVGLGVWAAGCALRVWAVWALGPNWRIGQDEKDQRHEFVARGPYRFYKHPINLALVIVAVGQGVLTGLDVRAGCLVAAAVVYALVQNAREERYWRAKRSAAGMDQA